MTLYSLKPRFQRLLEPLARALVAIGITPNQVTIAAASGSVGLGLVLALLAERAELFLLLPVWFAARMALNALDGLMARRSGQASPLGAYLNELADVVSDAALILPFALVAPFSAGAVVLVAGLAGLSELAGVLGAAVGGERRLDGPMGKSDRALVFGALGLWVGSGVVVPAAAGVVMPIVAGLLIVTIVKRVRAGVASVAGAGAAPPHAADTDLREDKA